MIRFITCLISVILVAWIAIGCSHELQIKEKFAERVSPDSGALKDAVAVETSHPDAMKSDHTVAPDSIVAPEQEAVADTQSPSPTDAVVIQQFLKEYVGEICLSIHARCCGAGEQYYQDPRSTFGKDATECKATFLANLTKNYPWMPYFKGSQLRAKIDRKALADCLKEYKQVKCLPTGSQAPSCQNIFRGTQTSGQPCMSKEECPSDHICKGATQGTKGTCQLLTYTQVGGTCTRGITTCAIGLTCIAGRCSKPKKLGDTCQNNVECESGTICTGGKCSLNSRFFCESTQRGEGKAIGSVKSIKVPVINDAVFIATNGGWQIVLTDAG